MALDFVIQGGTVLDGLGGEAIRADVGIRGERIAAVTPALDAGAALRIDASGLVVAPGFIDIHAHGDTYPLICPDAAARLHDGVTTELVGNCGASAFPQSESMLAERADSAARFGIAVDWVTLDDFARRQEAVGSAINRGTLVGHTNVRQVVVGEADRAPTEAELAAMCREVEEALEAGAFGFSTGLIYAPGMYAQPEEIEALCEVVARHDGLYASHIRGEGDRVESAVEEFSTVGRRTGVRLQYSHVKVSGEANWPKADRLIERLHELRAEGIDLACDRYPYTAASTGLSALLPGWAREGGRESLLARIADGATRRRLVDELNRERPDPAAWGAVLVSNAACETHRHVEGRALLDVATESDREPADVALDLLAASGGRAGIVYFSTCEENLVKWLRLPFVAIGTDGTTRSAEGPTAEGRPHPRSYGTFARFLGRYVREQQVLPLPEAVRRLTSLPASRIGLTHRGVLRPGAYADVTIFDPGRIEDRATYECPQQYSVGVRHVLVNGAVAVADGELTGARTGRFLRKGTE